MCLFAARGQFLYVVVVGEGIVTSGDKSVFVCLFQISSSIFEKGNLNISEIYAYSTGSSPFFSASDFAKAKEWTWLNSETSDPLESALPPALTTIESH